MFTLENVVIKCSKSCSGYFTSVAIICLPSTPIKSLHISKQNLNIDLIWLFECRTETR